MNDLMDALINGDQSEKNVAQISMLSGALAQPGLPSVGEEFVFAVLLLGHQPNGPEEFKATTG